MKPIVIGFGLLIFALLCLFQLAQYSPLGGNLHIEVWIAVFSLLFFGIGVVISRRMFRKEIVREKEVIIDRTIPFNPDNTQLEKTGLSKREFEILSLINEGLSNQQIAEKLFVSENTVKKHISNVFLKLAAERRTEAIKKAKELRIIQ